MYGQPEGCPRHHACSLLYGFVVLIVCDEVYITLIIFLDIAVILIIAYIVNDLKNRGVQDVLFFCVDGPAGFKEAIGAVYPDAQIHKIQKTCIGFKELAILLSEKKFDSAKVIKFDSKFLHI